MTTQRGGLVGATVWLRNDLVRDGHLFHAGTEVEVDEFVTKHDSDDGREFYWATAYRGLHAVWFREEEISRDKP